MSRPDIPAIRTRNASDPFPHRPPPSPPTFMTSSIIIDDQDARIKYSGLWTNAGSDVNYNHTLSSSNATGATMSFTFSGTSVYLVGDFGSGGTCSYSLTLDGAVAPLSSQNYPSPEHQQTIFSSDILTDGEHTLVYTLSSCQPAAGNVPGSYIWLDYLLYTPSINASVDGVKYFIDDTDNQLKYTGNWTELGEDGDFRHTKHGGNTSSTLQFTFQGTAISVHGRVNNGTGNTQGTFSIDGSSPTTFTAPPQSTISYNKEMFANSNLSPGQHTLIVTSQTDDLLWIDYLLVQPGSATTSPNASTNPSKSGLSVATIVGIVLGSLVLVAAIVFLVFYLKRSVRPLSKQPVDLRRKYIRPSAEDAASTLYRIGDGYSYVPPSSPGHSVTALLATSHDYPPSSSRSYTESHATSSFQDTSLPSSRSPSRAHSYSRSHSHSRVYTAPSTSGASSATSGLTRMRSVTVSDHSETSSSVRQPRVLPRIPGSTSSHSTSTHHTGYVDSGFRIDMDNLHLVDDKNPPEPPPAYTPR